MARTLDQLRETFEQLTLQEDIARLQRQAESRQRRDHYNRQVRNQVRGPRDVSESVYPEFVDPALWAGPEQGWAPFAQRDQQGNLNPIIKGESDLRLLQAISRTLWDSNPWLTGLKDDLQNYAIGQGFVVNITTKRGQLKAAIDRAQDFVNEFLESIDWHGDLDREFFWRTIQDGEANLRLYPRLDDYLSEVRVVEPEYLTRPNDVAGLEDWIAQTQDVQFPLGAPETGPLFDWSYGIQSPAGDSQTKLGYFVLWNQGTNDWDYIPENLFIRQKRNTVRTVKPGLPDSYCLGPIANKCLKLLRSMISGARKQSQYAMCVEYETQATTHGAQIGAMVQQDAQRQAQPRAGTGEWQAGAEDEAFIYHAPAGRTVTAGPMAQSNAATYDLILQSGLRCIGARWSAPEFLISADASNANFSSSMVAESPFVKNMLACQYQHEKKLKELVFKAMRHAYDDGYFDGMTGGAKDWREFQRTLNLDSDAPPVETRDKHKETQRRSVLFHDGVLNSETYAAEEGHDLAEEKQKSGVMLNPGAQPMGANQIMVGPDGQPVMPSPQQDQPPALGANGQGPEKPAKPDQLDPGAAGTKDQAAPGQAPAGQQPAPAPAAPATDKATADQATIGKTAPTDQQPAGQNPDQKPAADKNASQTPPGGTSPPAQPGAAKMAAGPPSAGGHPAQQVPNTAVANTPSLDSGQLKAAQTVIQDWARGAVTDAAAHELLLALGIKHDSAQRMLSEKPNVVDQPQPPMLPGAKPGLPGQPGQKPGAPGAVPGATKVPAQQPGQPAAPPAKPKPTTPKAAPAESDTRDAAISQYITRAFEAFDAILEASDVMEGELV